MLIRRYREYCAVISNEHGIFVGLGMGVFFSLASSFINHHFRGKDPFGSPMFWIIWIPFAFLLGIAIHLTTAFLLRRYGKKMPSPQKRKLIKEREAWAKQHQWKIWVGVGAIVIPQLLPGLRIEVRTIYTLVGSALFLFWMGFFFPKNSFSLKKGSFAEKYYRGNFVFLKVMSVALILFVLWLIHLENSRI